jgi:predicted tellurium resistance membrane protein TerC
MLELLTDPNAWASLLTLTALEIVLLDIVFSLDSVITAVGMADELPIMILAVVIAIGVMLVASEPVSRFVNEHPTVKMLALSFLLLVGMALVADGLHYHIPRGYLYFAIAFSAAVEALNLMAARARRRRREQQAAARQRA